MKIIQTGLNVDLTDPMKKYIDEKIGILKRYFKGQDEVLEARVDVRIDTHHKTGEVYMVSVNFVVKGKDFYAKERHDDFYGAIDIVQEELETQMLKHKEQLKEGIGGESIRKEE
ncbi:ribosome hibernation-promoting factor, HPF/YfiA family [Patescibacteria group bacterium]